MAVIYFYEQLNERPEINLVEIERPCSETLELEYDIPVLLNSDVIITPRGHKLVVTAGKEVPVYTEKIARRARVKSGFRKEEGNFWSMVFTLTNRCPDVYIGEAYKVTYLGKKDNNTSWRVSAQKSFTTTKLSQDVDTAFILEGLYVKRLTGRS